MIDMQTLHLEPHEIADMTDRIRPSAQARKLREMGINFILSGDGRPLVQRRYYEGLPVDGVKPKRKTAPRLDMVG